MQRTADVVDRERIAKLDRAYASSAQIQMQFKSRDDFAEHMLKAEWESDRSLWPDYPTAAAFVACMKRARNSL